MLAATLSWEMLPDGWLHWVEGDIDLMQGPMGMILGLVFVPGYWLCPPKSRRLYLIGTSLVLALVTLGPAYALTFAAMVLFSGEIVQHLAKPGRRWIGTLLLAMGLFGWLMVPQPPWLPEATPLYFHYLHWAGIAYVFLRTYHVLADVAGGRYSVPSRLDFLAYLLFLPTMRMGPIQRFPEFTDQLHRRPLEHARFLAAGGRVLTAGLRLWAMAFLLETFPPETRLDHPDRIPALSLIVQLYAAPFPFFFWLSAYTDLSIAMGYLMGYRLPDNFNYCWSAPSIDVFWRRWHITLGSWLHDYLFLPLIRKRMHYFAAFVLTFLFCGVWHGTYLSYIVWGLSQGVGMGVRRMWHEHWRRQGKQKTRLYQFLRRYGLVQSRGNRFISWLVNFHYQILTMNIFLFEYHEWWPLTRRVLEVMGLIGG